MAYLHFSRGIVEDLTERDCAEKHRGQVVGRIDRRDGDVHGFHIEALDIALVRADVAIAAEVDQRPLRDGPGNPGLERQPGLVHVEAQVHYARDERGQAHCGERKSWNDAAAHASPLGLATASHRGAWRPKSRDHAHLEVNVAAGLPTAPGNAVGHTPTPTACPAARLRG